MNELFLGIVAVPMPVYVGGGHLTAAGAIALGVFYVVLLAGMTALISWFLATDGMAFNFYRRCHCGHGSKAHYPTLKIPSYSAGRCRNMDCGCTLYARVHR